MKKNHVFKLVLSAMFLALGIVLPQIVKAIPIQNVGSVLLPMHIPVLLCGFVCGCQYGFIVGALTPILCSTFFSMPPLFPTAVSMAFELATYGFVAGILYVLLNKSVRNKLLSIYITLIASMIAGRIVMGIVNTILLAKGKYGFDAFIAGAFVTALPGIIIQLIVIPVILVAFRKAKLIK